MDIYISAAIALVVGIIIGYAFFRGIILKKKSRTLLREAEMEGENIKREKILQAKEKFLQLKAEHEQILTEKNNKIAQIENRLKQREVTMNQNNAEIQRKQKEVTTMRETLATQIDLAEKKVEEYEKLRLQQIEKIESIAGMSAEEAKMELVESMKEEAAYRLCPTCEVMDEARLTAEKKPKNCRKYHSESCYRNSHRKRRYGLQY